MYYSKKIEGPVTQMLADILVKEDLFKKLSKTLTPFLSTEPSQVEAASEKWRVEVLQRLDYIEKTLDEGSKRGFNLNDPSPNHADPFGLGHPVYGTARTNIGTTMIIVFGTHILRSLSEEDNKKLQVLTMVNLKNELEFNILAKAHKNTNIFGVFSDTSDNSIKKSLVVLEEVDQKLISANQALEEKQLILPSKSLEISKLKEKLNFDTFDDKLLRESFIRESMTGPYTAEVKTLCLPVPENSADLKLLELLSEWG